MGEGTRGLVEGELQRELAMVLQDFKAKRDGGASKLNHFAQRLTVLLG